MQDSTPNTEQQRVQAAPARDIISRRKSSVSCADLPTTSAAVPLTVILSPPDTRTGALAIEGLRHLAVHLVRSEPPLNTGDPRLIADLVVLDTGELYEHRESAIRQARSRWPSALIVCLNAETERCASQLLEHGADIALCADASPSYVRNVLGASGRRLEHANAQMRIAYGDLVFDRDARRVWCAGVPVSLTERELQLFQYLFLHAGHIVSQAALATCAWRVDPTIRSNGVAVYIGYLRRKLARSRVTELVTVQGEGYGLTMRTQGNEPRAEYGVVSEDGWRGR